MRFDVRQKRISSRCLFQTSKLQSAGERWVNSDACHAPSSSSADGYKMLHYRRDRWAHSWLAAEAKHKFAFPCACREVSWGSGGMLHQFSAPSLDGSGQLFTPAALPPEKHPLAFE